MGGSVSGWFLGCDGACSWRVGSVREGGEIPRFVEGCYLDSSSMGWIKG